MDNDDNVIELTPQKIAKLRNLKPYRDKTDDEIKEIIQNRKPRVKKPAAPEQPDTDKDYDRRFDEKMAILLTEFAIDMNNSNDAEGVKNLVRMQIQLENVAKQIEELQRDPSPSKDEIMMLKNLGDFQRTLMTSLSDVQEKLGINRKQRKEKQVDDIPVWIEGILSKAKTFYDRKTTSVDCPKCMIELFRYWENFPREKNDIELSLTCWKCKEVIEYTG